MNYPSVKTLTDRLSIDRVKAKQIRAIMTGPRYEPVNQETRLRRIDRVLGNCGVEHIRRGSNQKSPAICYSNTGDPYGQTVMKIEGRFVVGCWGDLVERGNYE